MNIGALYKTGYGYGRAEGGYSTFEVLDRGLISGDGSWWRRSVCWDEITSGHSRKDYKKFVLPEEYLL